jgi:hypothetical protein
LAKFRLLDFDDETFESGMIRQVLAEPADRVRFLKERNGQIDRRLDRPTLGEEVVPIINRTADHGVRQRREARVAIIWHEIGRRNDPPSRMANAQQRLDAAHDDGAGIDFRLIPEFELAPAHGLGHVHQRA